MPEFEDIKKEYEETLQIISDVSGLSKEEIEKELENTENIDNLLDKFGQI